MFSFCPFTANQNLLFGHALYQAESDGCFTMASSANKACN
jgi:hypothetical protein